MSVFQVPEIKTCLVVLVELNFLIIVQKLNTVQPELLLGYILSMCNVHIFCPHSIFFFD